MLENTKNIKKLYYYKIIYMLLALSGITGFFLPWVILNKSTSSQNLAVSLTSMAGYLRILSSNKSRMFIDIALHNTSIAIFGFILSFFSRGALGCLALFLNMFVLGAVLYDIHTLPTILFVFLEFLGICVAIFGGTSLAKRRSLCSAPLKSVFKSTLIIIFTVAAFYLVASIIESKVILSKWG